MTEGCLYINMGLRHYLMEKLENLSVDASTSKAKGKDAGRWMRKNDEAETAAAGALSAPVASLGEGKENEKMVRQSRVAYDVCMNCQRALKEEVLLTPLQPRCCNCYEQHDY
ncbi:UNVERIFIED_CONTAM: hypothetical protein Slati_1679000 [Sesamum latifolium]|uniref:DksA C4-type domain-containing protein n=1 Tax=Sesamum latifolium TaxID=2727402 RepID=A0AAW2X092_9LAMI